MGWRSAPRWIGWGDGGEGPPHRAAARPHPRGALRSAHKSTNGLNPRCFVSGLPTVRPVPGFGVRPHPGLTKAGARCAGCRTEVRWTSQKESEARERPVRNGEATSLLDSPRSGRTPSLARGAGERQTPVRQRARAYLEAPEALSTSLSVTCVPNGAAPRGCRARGSAVRGPLRGRREAMVGNHCVAVG